MKKQIIILTMLLLLSCVFASAKTYHITLLTIGESGDKTFGGTADAYLEVKYGSGRIYLDSFPLTKLDTQISTRYANEIACDFLNMDCSHYDFFYTIRADSSIVGGPSASAPLTVLTIAALKKLDLRNDTVMTGTINSGGSIGPVGGTVKKAMAAQQKGFSRVLIPAFSIDVGELINETNKTMNETNGTDSQDKEVNITIDENPIDKIITIDITNITSIIRVNNTNINKTQKKEPAFEDANLTIQVIKVSNIDEALPYFTDHYYDWAQNAKGEIKVPEEYSSTMKSIAESLCKRAFDLRRAINLSNESDINKSDDFMEKINNTFSSGDYYSSASYCFNLGVLLRKANFKSLDSINPEQMKKISSATKKAVESFNDNLEQVNLTTLSELEAYIIVKERLLEAEETLSNAGSNISSDELAYAVERYYSAVYWSEFFKVKGKKMQLDKEYLKAACYKKLAEADERLNYAELYLPLEMQSAKDTIAEAQAFAVQENYKMCLFKASFAKAESNLLLSTLSIGENQVNELANAKLRAAKKVIVKEQGKGFFPIMGYSYYEYANSLNMNNDSISGLIFSEYALELSNIDIYFPRKGFGLPILYLFKLDSYILLLFASGTLMGVAIGLLIASRIWRKKNRKMRKR
jgi:uncharacterized protein